MGFAATGITSANSWSFFNVLIAGNNILGLYVKGMNALTYVGGSIQYGGAIGMGEIAAAISRNRQWIRKCAVRGHGVPGQPPEQQIYST